MSNSVPESLSTRVKQFELFCPHILPLTTSPV